MVAEEMSWQPQELQDSIMNGSGIGEQLLTFEYQGTLARITLVPNP